MLITQRSLVQIQPPQPFRSSTNPDSNPLGARLGAQSDFWVFLQRLPYKKRPHRLAVGCPLVLHRHLAVLCRGANVGVPHQLLLYVKRSFGPPLKSVSYLCRKPIGGQCERPGGSTKDHKERLKQEFRCHPRKSAILADC
jgi:hypothetical protein